jgi:Na+/phosphate symporter
LAYPILAMIYIRTHTTDTNIIVGYGLAQLGYLLIASGIFKGTFLVFNIDGRFKTIFFGICFLLIGTALINSKIY